MGTILGCGLAFYGAALIRSAFRWAFGSTEGPWDRLVALCGRLAGPKWDRLTFGPYTATVRSLGVQSRINPDLIRPMDGGIYLSVRRLRDCRFAVLCVRCQSRECALVSIHPDLDSAVKAAESTNLRVEP